MIPPAPPLPLKTLVLGLFFLPVVALALTPEQRQQIETLGHQGRWAEARPLAQGWADAAPADAEAQSWLGRSLLALGETSRAVTVLEKAVALAPNSGGTMRLLGDAYGASAQKAGILAKAGWVKRCRVAFEKAVELDPKDLDAHWGLMEFYRQAPGFLGGGLDKARAQAEVIRALDAARGRAALVEIYLDEKKYPEAFALYDGPGPDQFGDYQPLYQLGKYADTSGELLDRGLAALRRCLAISPAGDSRGYAPVLWRIGNILARTGDPAGARAAYAEAVKQNPKFTEAAEALGKLGATASGVN